MAIYALDATARKKIQQIPLIGEFCQEALQRSAASREYPMPYVSTALHVIRIFPEGRDKVLPADSVHTYIEEHFQDFFPAGRSKLITAAETMLVAPEFRERIHSRFPQLRSEAQQEVANIYAGGMGDARELPRYFFNLRVIMAHSAVVDRNGEVIFVDFPPQELGGSQLPGRSMV